MTARMASFTFTRPRVLVPSILAVIFLAKGWAVMGFICALVAVTRAARLLGDGDLDQVLKLRQDKLMHGVQRLLSNGERTEIAALDAYAQALEARGVDAAFGREVRQRGWEIVRGAGINDATVELKRFRQSLPLLAVPAPGAADESLQTRLERELAMLHAGHRELDSWRT